MAVTQWKPHPVISQASVLYRSLEGTVRVVKSLVYVRLSLASLEENTEYRFRK